MTFFPFDPRGSAGRGEHHPPQKTKPILIPSPVCKNLNRHSTTPQTLVSCTLPPLYFIYGFFVFLPHNRDYLTIIWINECKARCTRYNMLYHIICIGACFPWPPFNCSNRPLTPCPCLLFFNFWSIWHQRPSILPPSTTRKYYPLICTPSSWYIAPEEAN